jgi:hypothetical protein
VKQLGRFIEGIKAFAQTERLNPRPQAVENGLHGGHRIPHPWKVSHRHWLSKQAWLAQRYILMDETTMQVLKVRASKSYLWAQMSVNSTTSKHCCPVSSTPSTVNPQFAKG